MSGEVQTQATTIYCPQCGQAMRIAPEHVQVAVACPQCSHTLEPWRLVSPTPPAAAPMPGAPPPSPGYAHGAEGSGNYSCRDRSTMSEKKRMVAAILAFFFGVFGAHRFYVGKIGTAIVQLLTIGGLGIWSTIDFIIILFGEFTDREGKKITDWT